VNVSCPECGTVFRVDPAKVPAGGVQARCSVCTGVMNVLSEEEAAEEAATSAVAAPTAPQSRSKAAPAEKPDVSKTKAPEPPKRTKGSTINPFLSRDPGMRAKRLARALISDMVTYYPAKHEEGLKQGTLKKLFKDEIKKSYEEYVSQVGTEFAESTTFFQDSLNELLANGKKVF
jgi:predicted Zn finger-like uncharacterized protein